MVSPLGPDANARFQKLDKVVLLSQCPLFSGLSSWELRSISQLMRLTEYKKDEVVYHEGGETEGFYVIASGRFEAYAHAPEKPKVLAYLRRGDYFGEMSLLTNQPHSATIKALSDSLVLEIKKDDFKKSIEHNATISLELSRRLSTRLKVTDSRSRSLFKCDVVSICGNQPKNERGRFTLNFASSLYDETHQKTILIDLSTSSSAAPITGERVDRIPMDRFQELGHSSSGALKGLLATHRGGFDLMHILSNPSHGTDEETLILLLNHLAVDYRFVLIDLPEDIDECAMKAISQSDNLYVICNSHLNSMTEAKETIADVVKTLSFPENHVSVVIEEVVFGAHSTGALRREFFGLKRCFSLPATDAPSAFDGTEFTQHLDPDTDYARTIRHIARSQSGNLVGLALGSGAALGLAHIGVLKVLEREKIPVDIIAGSSIGALIGSLYAVGASAYEIEKAALEIDLRLLASRLIDISLFPWRGLMHGNQVLRHFRKHLGKKTFENCRIPLRVTGSNLTTRQSFIYDSGSITDAVRASIAIPAIIKPIFKAGDVIIDGGILNPLPIEALREAGANRIIAVNVFPTTKDMMERKLLFEEKDERARLLARDKGPFSRLGYRLKKWGRGSFAPNIIDILVNTIQSMEAQIADIEAESADIMLRPVIPNANWMDFYKPEMFIRKGEEETMRALPALKSLVAQQNG